MTKSPTNNEYMGRMAMPSDKYINLTWGASGTSYTAPANGFFGAEGRCNANGHVALWCPNIPTIADKNRTSANGQICNASIPVKKGTTVRLDYANYVSDGSISFAYAEGSKPST